METMVKALSCADQDASQEDSGVSGEDESDAGSVVESMISEGATVDKDVFAILLKCHQCQSTGKNSSNDARTCLIEAVYKNNSVVTQLFTDALEPLCQKGQVGEEQFESLLVDSIKRGCSSSIVRNINRLWAVKIQKLSAAQRLGRYKQIIGKAINPTRTTANLDSSALSICLSLGLFEMTTDVCKLLKKHFQSVNQTTLDKLRKHTIANPGRIATEFYLEHLFRGEMSLEEIIKLTQRMKHLSSQNTINGESSSDSNIYRRINSYLTQFKFDEDAEKETSDAKKAVAMFMVNLSVQLRSVFGTSCTAKLVGSALLPAR